MAARKRDYDKEYKDYQGKPEQIARRSQRNKARRAAAKKGLVHKGDGQEVDHLGMNRLGKLNNKRVKVVSQKANRSRQPKRNGKDD